MNLDHITQKLWLSRDCRKAHRFCDAASDYTFPGYFLDPILLEGMQIPDGHPNERCKIGV